MNVNLDREQKRASLNDDCRISTENSEPFFTDSSVEICTLSYAAYSFSEKNALKHELMPFFSETRLGKIGRWLLNPQDSSLSEKHISALEQSAAAELAICNYRELLETIRTERERMHRSMRRKLEVASLHTARYAEKFRYLSPSGKLKSMRQQLADYEEQIPKAMHQRLEQEQERTRKVQEMLPLLMERNLRESRQQLAIRIERMKGLSPLAKLNQGFSYVQGSEGTVKKVADVKKGDWLRIYVTDGQIEAQVTDTKKE